MEENKEQTRFSISPPSQFIAQTRCSRFGKIFSNLGFFCSIVLLISVIAIVAIPMMYSLLWLGIVILLFVLIAAIILFTVGTVFVSPNNPVSFLWGILSGLVQSPADMTGVVNIVVMSIPYFAIIGLGVSALGLTFLAIGRPKNWIVRTVFLGIFMALNIVGLVLYYTLGGLL
ncbi:MAG: hypothetical protein J6K39_03920 [Clostridia bacterium]|nr:hypothetical protein [Clostridia bacterium]